jgi:hypothetical protein
VAINEEAGSVVSTGIAGVLGLQEGGGAGEVEVAAGEDQGPGLGTLMMRATIATTAASTPAIALNFV